MKTKAKLRQSYLESQKLTDVRIMLKVADAFNAGYEAAMGQLQPQPFHNGPDVYIIDANNLLPKPMVLTIAERDQFADASKVMNSSKISNSWISVKDQLPESIADVLVLNKEKELCVGYYRSSDNDWNMYNPCCSFHMQLHNVTHWMPLPKLPEEK